MNGGTCSAARVWWVSCSLCPCTLSLWLRLRRALRRAQDSLVRYRLNFARLLLIVLIISGILFRVQYICIDSMFLIALVVGTAEWAQRQNRLSQELLEPALAESLPAVHPAGQIAGN